MASAISQFLPLGELRKLLRENEVAPRHRARARQRLVFAALTTPLRALERLRHGAALRRTEIHPSPLFLLGYGRSGTTHLHNLVAQDPGFGVVTNYLANMYPVALVGRGWLDDFFRDKLPATRPMDNVAIRLDGPQEEEIALVNATARAPLHFMSFPDALPEMYDRWVTDLGHDAEELAVWKRHYLELLRKATMLSGGKRLALKTPTNTGRVPVLLELFPDARFVHIVRNPYRVYQSMRNMYAKILPGQVLQDLDWDVIERFTVDAYPKLMKKYLADRERIPEGHLFEVKYEELDEKPMTVLEQVYGTLGLEGFERARPLFETYLETLGEFEKNRFDFPADVVETVNEHWGFAFEAFGYTRIEPGAERIEIA